MWADLELKEASDMLFSPLAHHHHLLLLPPPGDEALHHIVLGLVAVSEVREEQRQRQSLQLSGPSTSQFELVLPSEWKVKHLQKIQEKVQLL